MHPRQTGVAADPEVACQVARQRADAVGRQTGVNVQTREVMPVVAAQAGIECADPYASVHILDERPRLVARQPFLRRVRDGSTVQELVQAVLGSHPEASLAVFEQPVHRALRQAVLAAETLDVAGAQAAEAIPGARPHAAFAALP
jgi:hypothetical protein